LDGASARGIEEAVEAAMALARQARELGREAAAARLARRRGKGPDTGPRHRTGTPSGGELAAWAKKLLALERAARRHGGRRAVNTVATFGRSSGRVAVANSHGLARVRWSQRATAQLMVVVAEAGRGVQRWIERAGRTGTGDLLAEIASEDFALRATGRALAVLRARRAPGGCFPVILDPATGGLLVHECLGHNAEADLVLSGQSILAGKLGRRLACPEVTIVDDANLPGAFGSYEFDSEGTPAQRTEIISRGRLVSYLHSLETAARFGARPTGNGRAEGSSSPPLVRMSNTFFAPGPHRLNDMIREVHRGLLLEHGSSGHVLSEKGHYTCQAGCGRLIENGRLGELVREVSMSGLVLETLRGIDAVSSDFALASPGYCGKEGQMVPVDNGGAYVRVRRAVIGGQGRWPRRRRRI